MRIISVAALVAAGVLAGSIAAGPAAAQSACADLGGTVTPDGVCAVHATNPTYTLDMSFPNDYPDQQALTDYLTHERDQEVDYAAQFPPAPDRISWSDAPGRYDFAATGTAYRSGTPASGTQSLVFRIANDTGAANEGRPATSYTAFNYDLGKGAPITFDTLFKPGTQPLEVLNPIVQRQLDKHGGAGALSLNDLGVKAYQNFAITDDAVTFFFNQDGLLPHEDGPLQVEVPRTALASLLA